ncbi:MAG: hypothetical protein WKF82_09165 [Nocardioidaceae bacterium]
MKAAYHEQLTAYLATQRWFAGKDQGFEVVHVHDLPWLASEAMNVRVEVVTVEFADGQRDDYQFLATYQEELDPARAHALVGEIEHPELGLRRGLRRRLLPRRRLAVSPSLPRPGWIAAT